jgi:hypothetical protein
MESSSNSAERNNGNPYIPPEVHSLQNAGEPQHEITSPLTIPPDREQQAAKTPLHLFTKDWDPVYLCDPAEAASEAALAAKHLFIPRDQRRIGLIDTSPDYREVNPPQGPAIVGLLHSMGPGHVRLMDEPADLIAAQKTRVNGLVTVEWHHADQLAEPGPCGDGNCIRWIYDGTAGLELQDITGERLPIENTRVAWLGLRWALGTLDYSGAGYDPTPYDLTTNALARKVVEAGHQLTIPDAATVSRVLNLPYTER